MRKIMLCSLLCISLLSNARRWDVNSVAYCGPYFVQTPYLVDSTDVNAVKFSEKELLKTAVPLADVERAKTFVSPAIPTYEKPALHLFSFLITPENYAEVNVRVNTSAPYQLYIDGQEARAGAQKLTPYPHRVIVKCLGRANVQDSLRVYVESEQENVSCTNALSHRYSMHDVLDGVRFRDASLSPDGRYLITAYTRVAEGGRTSYFTRLSEVQSGKILTETDRTLRWMPRTNRYYYTRAGENGLDLVAVAPQGGESVLSRGLPNDNFILSPTEDFLIFSENEEGPKEDPQIYQILTPDDRQPGWRMRTCLSRLDLKTGVRQRLTYGHRSTVLNDISADGQWLLFSVTNPRITQRPFYPQSVFRMNVRTLQVDTLLRNEGFINNCLFSPDGKKLLVSASPEAFGGIGLNVKAGQTASMIDGQLFLFDIGTHRATPLTRTFNPSVTEITWNAYDGQVYFLAEDRDCVSLFTLNTQTGKIRSMQAREEVLSRFNVATAAPQIVYFGQSASNSLRLYTCSTKGGQAVCREDLSKDLLKEVELGTCRTWDYVNSRGDTISGRFYLPPHFDANSKYPLIVNYYGGCSPTSRTMESRYPQHLYAAQGYVVYVLQPSGATGFGQEFSARHVNTFGDFVADDIIEGTRRFCAEHTYVDSTKIGCIGASYGGFMTQSLCTKTSLFAAAISHAGISNQASYWGEGYWGYSYSEISAAGSYPWNNPQLYTTHSPLFNADKVRTPLLFLHGSTDMNVPIGESIQMFTALKMLGRETAFVTVEGQGHHILDYGKRMKWQNTIFAWFAKWLKGQPQWWDALYPPKDL